VVVPAALVEMSLYSKDQGPEAQDEHSQSLERQSHMQVVAEVRASRAQLEVLAAAAQGDPMLPPVEMEKPTPVVVAEELGMVEQVAMAVRELSFSVTAIQIVTHMT